MCIGLLMLVWSIIRGLIDNLSLSKSTNNHETKNFMPVRALIRTDTRISLLSFFFHLGFRLVYFCGRCWYIHFFLLLQGEEVARTLKFNSHDIEYFNDSFSVCLSICVLVCVFGFVWLSWSDAGNPQKLILWWCCDVIPSYCSTLGFRKWFCFC